MSGKEDIRLHLIYLANKFRKDHGIRELTLDKEMARNAKAHSEHRVDRFDGLDTQAHSERHLRLGMAELVAWCETHSHEHPYQTAERLFESWTKSNEGHRAALLNPHFHSAGLDIGHRWHNGRRRIFMTGRFR